MLRRNFIKNTTITGALFPVARHFKPLISGPETVNLVILHTNDVHSRIEPFPVEKGGRNAGKGGVARRASLIKKIREENEHVLLLDCGDILQGTPYFNFFDGEIEFQLMDKLKYDAATIGNHDFDGGDELLAKRLQESNFAMLNSNYKLNNSILSPHVLPYKIFNKGELKIGVFGVGIKLDGLVPKALYGDIEYLHPYAEAEKTAQILKKELNCDLVICLSHIGYKYREAELPSDVLMAQNTRYIDMILGGHTHTFMKKAEQYQNKDNEPVIVNQAGWAGIMLGRLDVAFEVGKSKKCYTCKNQYLGG